MIIILCPSLPFVLTPCNHSLIDEVLKFVERRVYLRKPAAAAAAASAGGHANGSAHPKLE